MKKHLVFLIVLLSLNTIGRANNTQPVLDSLQQVLAKSSGIEAANTLTALIEISWNADRASAFEYIEQLDKLAKQLSVDSISAFATYKKAIVTYLNGDYQNAADEFAEAAKLYFKSNQRGDALQASAREGVMYSIMGDNDKAAAIYSAALQKAEKHHEKEAEAYLLSQLATVFHYKGMPDSAEYYYKTSIEQYDALQDSSGMLRSMRNLIELKRENNDLSGSLKVLQSIYDFYMRNEHFDNAALTLENIGTTLSDMDLHNEAFEAHLQAFELGQKNGHKRIINTALIGMSRIEMDRANYESAKGYLIRALDYFLYETNDLERSASIQTNLGYIYAVTAKYDSAAYYYTSVLKLADSLSLERFRLRALSGLGEVHLNQGNLQEAQRITKQLAALSSTFSENSQRYSYYALEGLLRYELKDYSGAIPYLFDTYAFNIEQKRLVMALEKAEMLLESHKALGQPAQALEYAEAINWIKDSLNQQNDLELLAEQRKDFEFQIERQQIEAEQAKETAVLQAKARQNMLIAVGGILLAALGFGFFWYTRRQNQTIAEQNQQLQQINETKDRLFAIIGHDLRKPAIAFKGITKKVNYLLRKNDFETLEALGDSIERDASNLNLLTENLLKWALTQRDVMPYQPTSLNLKPLVEDTLSPFSRSLENKSQELLIDIPEHAVVYSDANALSTIIRNLVDNAIKFTPEGGQIKVRTVEENGKIRLDVENTGQGIAEDQLKKLFLLQKDNSQTGTAGEKGSGLGLHLAQELAKLNKSRLMVKSQRGERTVFSLGLPLG